MPRRQRANTDPWTVISRRAKSHDAAREDADKTALKKELEAAKAQEQDDPEFAEEVAAELQREKARRRALKKLREEDQALQEEDSARARTAQAERSEEGDPAARVRAEEEAKKRVIRPSDLRKLSFKNQHEKRVMASSSGKGKDNAIEPPARH